MPQAEETTVEIPEALAYFLEPALGAVRYRVAYGGRGSAKSWTIARALLLRGVEQPLRILCAREFQASIRDSVHRLLADQVQVLGLDEFYQVGQAAIVGANGTEFLFKGLRRDVAEVKSTEGIDLCWVEEAEAVSDTSWEVLIPTVRKAASEIWVSFNPALASDPTYRRFVERPPERGLVRHVCYTDNPWVPAVLRDEAASLRQRDPEAYAHVWGGQPWSRSDAQVLAGKWCVLDFTPATHWQGPYYGADWGFAQDPTVLLRLWIADRRLYVEYEAGGVQLDLDATGRAFDAVPGSREHVIRADSARPETIHEMVRRGFRVQPAPKWDGSVKDGIEHLRGYEQIVIHPRCARAQQEARLYRYKADPRTGDVLPKLHEGYDHTWDAARYALSPLIRQRSFTPVHVVWS